MFGTVELILDKRHTFTVSTAQATCLLKIEKSGKSSNKDLVDYLGNTDPTVIREMMKVLIESTIVSEENGFYTIE